MPAEIEIRECATLEEMAECVQIQREVFAMPEGELSPVRHFVVTKNAGGWALGAFYGGRLAGFVLSVPAFLRGERAFYSHMTGVRPEYQSHGIGAKLKWAQRRRAMSEGVRFIKWTFEPVKSRNAVFNLEKLGVVVREYMVNFYGTDYGTAQEPGQNVGLASDRLFAEWHLDSPRVAALESGDKVVEFIAPTATIQVMNDWPCMVANAPEKAKTEQIRIRQEFQTAFGCGMVCRGFWRDAERPAFLLYKE